MKQSKAIQLLKKHFCRRGQNLPILNHAVVNNDNIKCNDLGAECTLYIDEKISTINSVVDLSVLSAFADIKTITHITDDRIVNEFNDAKTDAKIEKLPVGDFPMLDKPKHKIEKMEGKQKIVKFEDGAPIVDILCSDLLAAIEKIDYAMDNKDVRYYLNGICFDFVCDKIKLIATDGHRLALTECNLMSESETYKAQHIVTRSTIVLLKSVLKLTDSRALSVTLGDNYIIEFRANDFLITAKLCDGKYPDYTRVVPKNNTELLKLNRKETLKTIKQLKPFFNKKYHCLIIDIEAREFEASNLESSMRLPMPVLDCSETIDKIGINADYLCDVLNNTTDETIDFYLLDKNSAIVATVNNSTHIIMPMRL